MAIIYIDGEPYEVQDGQNLLHACLSLGFDVPYFCWHPALHSVGACRQCAVKQFKDENDTRGRIVMACMTPAQDGTRISIDDDEARAFRASVIEWLMVNHPHDCPVCDEGGECHLQDMTVLTGHTQRTYRFQKRTHRNQYLGPLVNHEMNRCIACYRCVRFYRDYAGGHDLDVFGPHNHVYFGRFEDGVLESEFSGNLVEVCPTGVFTDKTLRGHYTRKWDLQTAPSVCVHCGLGCNTIPGERYGQLRRIRNRYNREVNGYFLCDRGRYGYEFVNDEARIRVPLLRDNGREPAPAVAQEAVSRAAAALGGGQRAIGIGSPRASLEANLALRTLVGAENFCGGVSAIEAGLLAAALRILQAGPARSPSLNDVSLADAVLVLGEDVTNTAPMMALALRQAARQGAMSIPRDLGIPDWHARAVLEAMQDERGPLYIATPAATKLDDVAAGTYRAAPTDLARLAFAVAHALDGAAPAVPGLPDGVAALADEIAAALRVAERPLVVSGTSCGSRALLEAAANVARALCQVRGGDGGPGAELSLVVPEGNSLGLALLGAKPLAGAFRAAAEGRVDTIVVLENDLDRRALPDEVDDFLAAARHVIVLDHLENGTTTRAEVVLPAATWAEGDGTLVNNEGRAQRFFQVFVPGGEVQESWRWLRDMAAAAGRGGMDGWQSLDDVLATLAAAFPALQPAVEAAPGADVRVLGQKIPRQSHRYTARTSMHADVDIHEGPPPQDPDSALAFSMEGFQGQPPAALIPRYWAPHWNSVQALNKFQEEVAGPLRGGDPGRRLIEPGAGTAGAYSDGVPAAFAPRKDAWLVVPLYHIFGSEALSRRAPAIAALAPAPYVALGAEDAQRLGVGDGDQIEVEMEGQTRRLPVRLKAGLPRGVMGLPVSLGNLPAWPLGEVWATIRPETDEDRQAG
jgi:NADH-quinone oxidoreductase subunit G